MKKIITIDIQSKDDLIEKYNCNIVNHSLIEYILKSAIYTKADEEIEIIIYNKCNTKIDIKEKISDGLKIEYEYTIKEHKKNNILQIFLLFLGIILLFLSTLINENFIWKEILLIGGWVPIWEMVDIELFKESKERRNKTIIEKLLRSEIKIES